MESINPVEDKREARELIRNASHLQKPHGCQARKRRVLSNEKERQVILAVSQLTFQHLQKEKK